MSFAPVQEISKNGQVVHGDDKGLYVEFEKRPVHMEADSLKEGRPIYKDVDFINIMIPGDRTKNVVRPVSDNDKLRFPSQWKAFENQEKAVISGTPITEWGILTKSQALEFKAMNIHTVEQMAEISDTALEGLGLGAREYREKAKLFISKATDGAALMALQTKYDNLQKDFLSLQEQLKNINKESTNGKKN